MNGLAHSEWVSGNARGIEESKRRSESLAFAIMLIRQVDASDRAVRYVLRTATRHSFTSRQFPFFPRVEWCKTVLTLLHS